MTANTAVFWHLSAVNVAINVSVTMRPLISIMIFTEIKDVSYGW